MPSSENLPHITVRVYKESDERAEETKKRQIRSLNVIEPETFGFEKKDKPNARFVVCLRFESEELESIEYKPDYPQSVLHITIYEGHDYDFAVLLLSVLKKCRWHFAIEYSGKKLKEGIIGRKPKSKPNFKKYYEDVFGQDYYEFENKLLIGDNKFRLNVLRELVKKINLYITENNLPQIPTSYSDKELKFVPNEEIDSYEEFTNIKEDFASKYPKENIFITPPEYASDMATSGVSAFIENYNSGDRSAIRFGDPAVGNGKLFLALKTAVEEYNSVSADKNIQISSAFGMDINETMAKEAQMRCGNRGLNVEWGDALLYDSHKKDSCNLMLVNPPFNKHNEIPADYKRKIKKIAEKLTGIKVSNQSGLFVYFVIIMHEWLADDGIAVWLLPTYFMQTKYGQTLKEYLINYVKLLGVHVYDEKYEQFYDTQVSTTVVVFQKRKPSDGYIKFSFGRSISRPDISIEIDRKHISSLANWRVYFSKNVLNPSIINNIEGAKKTSKTLGDYFEIKRGMATGANSFFTMTIEDAKRLGIPKCVLRPLLPKAMFLKSRIIEREEKTGYPLVDKQLVLIDTDLEEGEIKKKYPDFYSYLQTARLKDIKTGKAIVERALVKSRSPWYKQERRDVPPFLLTYMGRGTRNVNGHSHMFFLNRSDALALNHYLLLYPKGELHDLLQDNPKGEEYVLKLLERAEGNVSDNSRVYAGGLKKIEPKELLSIPIETINFTKLKKLKEISTTS